MDAGPSPHFTGKETETQKAVATCSGVTGRFSVAEPEHPGLYAKDGGPCFSGRGWEEVTPVEGWPGALHVEPPSPWSLVAQSSLPGRPQAAPAPLTSLAARPFRAVSGTFQPTGEWCDPTGPQGGPPLGRQQPARGSVGVCKSRPAQEVVSHVIRNLPWNPRTMP